MAGGVSRDIRGESSGSMQAQSSCSQSPPLAPAAPDSMPEEPSNQYCKSHAFTGDGRCQDRQQSQCNDCRTIERDRYADALREHAKAVQRQLAEEKKLSEAISRDCNNTALERNNLRDRAESAERQLEELREKLTALQTVSRAYIEKLLEIVKRDAHTNPENLRLIQEIENVLAAAKGGTKAVDTRSAFDRTYDENAARRGQYKEDK